MTKLLLDSSYFHQNGTPLTIFPSIKLAKTTDGIVNKLKELIKI